MSKKIQTTEPANHIAVFQETVIRCAWHAEEWWFSVIAGNACKALEGKSGKPVLSKKNYLAQIGAAALEDAATTTPRPSPGDAIRKKQPKRNEL